MKMQTTMMLLILATPVLRGDTCGNDLNRNGNFDLWCEDQLCGWTVEDGIVNRAPTWHRADYGVELQGAGVRMSQILQKGLLGGRCIHFTTLVDVEGDAQAEVMIDFFDDGTIDYRQPLKGSNWARSETWVTAPRWYQDARLIIEKNGEGRAVLAEVRLEGRQAHECKEAPIELVGATVGSPCTVDATCGAGGRCLPGLERDGEHPFGPTCGLCANEADCGAGQVCGVTTASARLPHTACAAAGADPLGAACREDEECGSGVCCGGTCSTCCPSATAGGEAVACAGAEACTNTLDDFQGLSLGTAAPAWRCSARGGVRRTGEPCIIGDDCASGTCTSSITLGFCWGAGSDCVAGDSCEFCNESTKPGLCR